ncbi:MAG: hypothetical protein D6696_19070 [Acidobacteria bacterium]|nr:MAG: hypothetical protein D6696_19070 [Acidobacteriota bacterium]
MLATGSTWALALGLLLTTADPRVTLVDVQLAQDPETALAAVEETLRQDPESARALGLDYLRAHLLLQTGRRQEALDAFVAALSSAPSLSAYSRLRLAQAHFELGRPRMAAGLLSTLLSSGPPRGLVEPAMELFERALAQGGDCRLLGGLETGRFHGTARRRLQLAIAGCALRRGEQEQAERTLFQILDDERRDDVALAAAQRLAALKPIERSARQHMLIGLAFYHQRDFDAAIQHLARTVARLPESQELSTDEAFETRYALARSHFWEGRYTVAAAVFGALAGRTRTPELRARVLYQQGRCYELADDWPKAIESYRRAHQADAAGEWSDSALMAQLRLLWRSERESDAQAVYHTLAQRRRSAAQRRALIFFASSDLVRGRIDRAGAWLASAGRLGRGGKVELAYWQGRLAELEGDAAQAVGHYLRALRENAYHPFALAARERLDGPALKRRALATGRQLAGSRRLEDLEGAWLLLGDRHEVGRGARRILEAQLLADAAAAPYLRLNLEPPVRWPLWQSPLRQPEEQLLALGLWDEGASVVLRHFPMAEPTLAFTGSLLLARAGATKRSLYIAEILKKRVPEKVPTQLLPEAFRRLLYPFRFGYLILREAERRGTDPYLLAAIIREESRFDPHAVSAAAARGLTQFVMPTAQQIASRIGLELRGPEDLERPEVAIALGAAYLHQLGEQFAGDRAQVVAAYNAGEPQAALWRRYCFSDEPAEYLSKVSFRESRGYLIKVLTSWAHYRELYAHQGAVAALPGAP